MSNPSPALSDQARWRRALGTVHKLCEIVSVAMFAALFLTFVAQIFWRYVLREPLVWTLEVAGILFVTTSLFTAATQMSLRDHVGMDLALGIAPPQVRRWLLTLSLGLFALVMLASVPDTVQVLKWMYRERTYAIGFNLGHLFVLMIFFVIAYVLRAVMAILRLWRAGWRNEV
jgi:TRAP-type C4-dicarboxylate transport system permease small subunit